MLREAGNKIVATIDVDNYYIMSSLYNGILINGKFNIKYVLALLNSEVYQFLMNIQTFSKTSGAFTKAKIYHYYPMPVKNTNTQTQLIIAQIVDYVLFEPIQTNELVFNFFENLIHALVYERFFDDEFNNYSNKQILSNLGNLKPITDEMSEEEKLAIIQSEFERLYDPSHPVRNAIETLDSIEEVRIIKEALK